MPGDERDSAQLLAAARDGDRRALARLISRAERGDAPPPLPAGDDPGALCLGITGAPGAGKSTLVNGLVSAALASHARVAVLAVDPSSPLSRGSLLGDRLRMHQHLTSEQVYIRSMATRGRLGGLAAATQGARRLLQACGWPLVLIETVGIGQVELDITSAADLALVVLNPGFGDEIQANKAGLMEVADLFVINKADRPGAAAARRDIEGVQATRPAAQRVPVLETVASEGQGVSALWQALAARATALRASGELARRRQGQRRGELLQQLRQQLERSLDDYAASPAFGELLQALSRGELDARDAGDRALAALLARLQPESRPAA